MKKLLSLLLVVSLMLGLTGSVLAETPANSAAPDLQGRTIKIMTSDTWVAGLTISDVLPRFKQIEERTGCTIIWETVASDYNTVLSTRLTGDPSECPDIVSLGDTNMNFIASLIEEGILYDITQAYDETPNIKAFWDEARPELKGTFTYYDGGIYNLLANVYNTADGQARWVGENGDNALWYRGDIAAALGYEDYPTTIDEWHELLLAVKENYPDMVPMHMWDWSCWESVRIFTSGYGLHFNNEQSGQFFYADENGVVQFEPALEATKEWLTEMNQWYEEGLVVVGSSEEQKIGAAANGTTFSGFYSGVTGQCEAALKEKEPNAYFLYAPFPTANDYELTVMGRAAYSRSYAVINNGDEDQCRAALQFLDYAFFSDYGIFSEKAGVEGEGWNFGSNGEFEPNADFMAAILNGDVVLQATGANIHFNGPTVSSYEVNKIWNDKNKELRLERGYVDPMNEVQQANWKEINAINTAAYCPYFPAFFMTSEDQDTLNRLSADLGTFTNEMLSRYILGTADIDNFQTEFVDVLYNSLNLQQVLDIYQGYYDTYLANSAS